MPLNLPNLITLGRLFLTAALLGVLSGIDAVRFEHQGWLLRLSTVMFIVAAVLDAVDGPIARRLNCVTKFGRIVDPLVDKVMICGIFTILAGSGFTIEGRSVTGVEPWMVVVIVARELLVSGIRASQEAAQRAFGALWAGKLKMLVQSVTAGVIIARLGFHLGPVWETASELSLWLMVAVTVLSAIPYVIQARRRAPEASPSAATDAAVVRMREAAEHAARVEKPGEAA